MNIYRSGEVGVGNLTELKTASNLYVQNGTLPIWSRFPLKQVLVILVKFTPTYDENFLQAA